MSPEAFDELDPIKKSKENKRSRPPIGDPNPSTEVANTHRGHQRPRWRGRGGRLAAPTPDQPRTPSRRFPVDSGLGPPIDDLDPSTEIVGPLRFGVGAANRRPRPLHRGRRYPRRTSVTSTERLGSLIGGPIQSATPTPNRPGTSESIRGWGR
ncbi:hypothetical protein CRG98_004291 [Punica granatum]|uniref:Uncharacterized protein n=1 Tax=Punica granatum TaxID=22663 RepID=A0A2I0L3H2_PUNGR|nr:hypothetical protein CRG98_004291 [Punica granatum]